LLHPDLDCDICRILELAHQKNLTISLWGDSVQFQVWDGLICEMTRRNYEIVSEDRRDMKEETGCAGVMFCLRDIYSVRVKSLEWGETASGVRLNFFFQYRPKDTVEDIFNESVKYILDVGTNILLFNFGVHWPYSPSYRKDEYVKRLTKTLETFQQYGKSISLLAFRETAAQHFPEHGGEHTVKWRGESCRAHSLNDTRVGWRDSLFREMAEGLDYKLVVANPTAKKIAESRSDQPGREIAILPFVNFSSTLHDLHPLECTHFCSTPHLWAPLWRSLRLSMDWKF
jgi:hypothetical protein